MSRGSRKSFVEALTEEAKPLLKFREEDDCAILDPKGLALLRKQRGLLYPVILIGDGRAGKSYLASRILGLEGDDGFVSSDSCEPVTEGIDVIARPIVPILKANGIEVQPDDHRTTLLVLDCEGGNNAMAAIRTLVNVFGIIVGTEVLFVANGMITEQALQMLVASLAARSLIRIDGGGSLPEQELIFVVNKNTLNYDDQALEKTLNTPQKNPSRQELRDTVKDAFPQRAFFPVPLMGMPTFEDGVNALCNKVIRSRRPLALEGNAMDGNSLAGLLELIVVEMAKTNEVSFPSMTRCVVMDGLLLPTVERILNRLDLPEIEDEYIADLAAEDPCPEALEDFDTEVAHVTQKELVAEARAGLEERLRQAWGEVVRQNEEIGNQVLKTETETREIEVSKKKSEFGGRGLLSQVVHNRTQIRIEQRIIVVRKRGGEPEASEWQDTGRSENRLAEQSFALVRSVPSLKGRLLKRSPNAVKNLLSLGKGAWQEREVIVKNGHMSWWIPPTGEDAMVDEDSAAQSSISFMFHRAIVEPVEGNEHQFVVRPADANGWRDAQTFTGGAARSFVLSAEGSAYGRDRWVEVIRKNIEFGNNAIEELGEERLHSEIGIVRPTYAVAGAD